MTSSSIHRRKLLLAGGGVAAAAALARMVRPSRTAQPALVVADPGGPYGPSYRKAFYDPFERASGLKVINVARQSDVGALFKAMVETKAFTWDVCTMMPGDCRQLGKLGLLEPLHLSAADVRGIMPEAVMPAWLGIDVVSLVQAYRIDGFGKAAPSCWADFWNVERFPGRRALSKDPSFTLEIALLADGVQPHQLYPLDVPRAFRSLDRIKPHVAVWWTSGAQSSQLIQSGEVDMIALWNARAQVVIDSGAPVRIVWNQGLYNIEGWVIPRGSPHAEAARRFVKFCADPARQAAFTDTLAYGPTNLAAYRHIPFKRAAGLPTAPANLNVMTMESESWWMHNRAAMLERFNIWILQ